MWRSRRIAFGIGTVLGLLVAAGIVLWWTSGPSDGRVRRTVITTVQEEAPASFLVTGTLEIGVTVRVDSSTYLTPTWLTYVLEQTQPGMLTMLQGGSEAQVRVPGTVSYGFNVERLRKKHIRVAPKDTIVVDLPPLAVHSVAPDLARLRVNVNHRGWMRLFPSDVPGDVRKRALAGVEEAFRRQANRHLSSTTQPRINTARALEKMLTPPLQAAGISQPGFRIRIGPDLVLTPRDGERASNFQK